MGEKLKNPPLIEALCQFVFHSPPGQNSAAPGDPAIADRLHDRIKSEFPLRSEVHRPDIEIPVVEGNRIAGSHVGPNLVQLKRKDESAIVQVGKNILVVNQLEPYPGWGEFKHLIIRVFREHGSLADTGLPFSIGLRYINRLAVPGIDIQISDFLDEPPFLRRPWIDLVDGFYRQYEFLVTDPEGRLIHKTGLRIADGERYIMLDLDFSSNAVQHFDWWRGNELAEWLDRAHDRVYEAFTASIKPELLQRMKSGVS